jgi:hypothetical protein
VLIYGETRIFSSPQSSSWALCTFSPGLWSHGSTAKRARIGDNQNDYDVLGNGVIVGRIFFLDADAP